MTHFIRPPTHAAAYRGDDGGGLRRISKGTPWGVLAVCTFFGRKNNDNNKQQWEKKDSNGNHRYLPVKIIGYFFFLFHTFTKQFEGNWFFAIERVSVYHIVVKQLTQLNKNFFFFPKNQFPIITVTFHCFCESSVSF